MGGFRHDMIRSVAAKKGWKRMTQIHCYQKKDVFPSIFWLNWAKCRLADVNNLVDLLRTCVLYNGQSDTDTDTQAKPDAYTAMAKAVTSFVWVCSRKLLVS